MSQIVSHRPRQAGVRRGNFAIVSSRYNESFVTGLVEHARGELEAIQPGATVEVLEVPGAFEIPLLVQEIATRGGIDAIIALGVIIQGETEHARLIAECVTTSLQRISLQNRVPIIHEVLLVADETQARVRCLEATHNRGTEAARAAIQMVEAMARLRR